VTRCKTVPAANKLTVAGKYNLMQRRNTTEQLISYTPNHSHSVRRVATNGSRFDITTTDNCKSHQLSGYLYIHLFSS